MDNPTYRILNCNEATTVRTGVSAGEAERLVGQLRADNPGTRFEMRRDIPQAVNA